MNTTNVGNLGSINPVTKTPPTSVSKGTPKDQKLFTSSSSSKSIDPVWLAQTKMETANIANANKMMVCIKIPSVFFFFFFAFHRFTK